MFVFCHKVPLNVFCIFECFSIHFRVGCSCQTCVPHVPCFPPSCAHIWSVSCSRLVLCHYWFINPQPCVIYHVVSPLYLTCLGFPRVWCPVLFILPPYSMCLCFIKRRFVCIPRLLVLCSSWIVTVAFEIKIIAYSYWFSDCIFSRQGRQCQNFRLGNNWQCKNKINLKNIRLSIYKAGIFKLFDAKDPWKPGCTCKATLPKI